MGIDYYGRHATAESELVKRTLATIKKTDSEKKSYKPWNYSAYMTVAYISNERASNLGQVKTR